MASTHGNRKRAIPSGWHWIELGICWWVVWNNQQWYDDIISFQSTVSCKNA